MNVAPFFSRNAYAASFPSFSCFEAARGRGRRIYQWLQFIHTSNREISRKYADFHTPSYETRSYFSTSSPSSRVTFFSPSITTYHKRWASQTASSRTAEDDTKITIGPKTLNLEKNNKETGFIYYGPISSTIKKVKLLSLSTCCLSVSLGPVITFMTSPDMNVILKGAVASTVMVLSASTTAALHWFVSPYIHKLRWQPGADSFEVEMMTWLATHVPRTIKFSNVRPPKTKRPFVTFKADGNFYFVDAEHCHNKALMARLTPREEAHDSAFKNL